MEGLSPRPPRAASREGRRGSFEALYEELFPLVWRYARALGSQPLAEEVVAEVFHRLVERLGDFDSARGSVVCWVLTITHHAGVDQLRRNRPAVPLDSVAEILVAESPSSLEVILREERDRELAAKLRALPAETRRLLELRYRQGLDSREIAALTGLSPSAVRQRLSRAVRALRSSSAAGEAAPEGEVTDAL
ncbi:MAG: sigma-70 family RNA polymerase sigma factor [Thermoanaerobaculia bacterium]